MPRLKKTTGGTLDGGSREMEEANNEVRKGSMMLASPIYYVQPYYDFNIPQIAW